MSNARNISVAGSSAPGGLAPAGVVLPFAGSTAPTGWLLCFGQAVSRTTYASLFTALGTSYGAGDGSTTFALPDLRGRIPGGKDNMGGSAASRLTSGGSGVDGATLGASGGTQTHTLTNAQLPTSVIGTGGSTIARGSTVSDLQTVGSGQAHNNTQPTIILNYIIKT
jgi:microcystin-dependent protein